MNELLINEKRYKFEKVLGQGIYGKVWLATHEGKKFAIKKIIIEDEVPHSMERETILIERLNKECPKHFTKYLGSRMLRGYRYILTEYFEGYTLEKFMNCQRETGFTLTIDQFLTFAKFLFTALECLHRNGFAHTDLNPGNIMFNKKEIKIIDFGFMCIPEDKRNYCSENITRFYSWLVQKYKFRDQFGIDLDKKNFPFQYDIIFSFTVLFQIGLIGGHIFTEEIGGINRDVSTKKLEHYYSKYISDHKDDKRAVKIVEWLRNIEGYENKEYFVVPKYNAKEALEKLDKISGKAENLY